MTNTQNIILDLTNPHISPPPTVYAKQGDSGSRTVVAKIIDNGADVTISAPCRIYFSGVGGGSPCYITGTMTSGAVTFTIPQTATRKSGTVKAEVQILNSDNAEEVIATMSFDLVVKQTAYNVGAIVGGSGVNLADQYVDEAVTKAVSDHNTSANAHEVLFGTLNTRVDGLDYGLEAAVTKLNILQTHPCYEYSASGGNVQRFDDVSKIAHNIGITVHGATDSDSRTVTNPKVNVYGKNLFKFASLTASGYTFSGSRCKIVNPTSAYHYCNGTEFMLNPGTYTYSCTVSGEVEYTASNAFRTFYEFNGTQYTLNMDGFGGGTQKYSATFTVTAPTTFKFKHVWFYGTPASANLSIDFQLEIGGKMTDYEPYIEPQTASPQTSFAEGEVFLVETFTAVSPTMTVVASDDNNLISTVDVTYNRDIGKALAAMS